MAVQGTHVHTKPRLGLLLVQLTRCAWPASPEALACRPRPAAAHIAQSSMAVSWSVVDGVAVLLILYKTFWFIERAGNYSADANAVGAQARRPPRRAERGATRSSTFVRGLLDRR
jgi:hypothetical protein